MQKHRISTDIGKDQFVKVELNQEFDLLEILSLKFTQKEAYASYCSDYGVVCGRIIINNGLGVPNARVSIFIPLNENDIDDPVISTLYPYQSVTERNDNNYRYNLLPARKQHGGHTPTGTFPDQTDILTREEYLEVYEKYYKFTVKTNESGDFMIWGVPLGSQTIHVDVDLSDIGCFSLRPNDFIRLGIGEDKFKNSYTFASSDDIDSLPQIISFDKTIDVYPFWGNESICEIGITRTDFDLSSVGVKIQPKAYFLGSVFSDEGKNSINKNCTPKGTMGQKCSLISESAIVEMIRFTGYKDDNNRPILETYDITEDVDEDGSFVIPLPMNMEYVYTNEFGENEVTNDPNKGIPTSACYRFRISIKNNSLGRVRNTASYLVPNIREYSNDVEKSYAWSLDWDDYPSAALNDTIIFKNEYGSYYPQDYFYRFNYNKVYGVSSFIGSYFTSQGISRHTYLGLKEIAPKEEDDCQNNVLTPPVNWGLQKFNFSILLAIIINAFEKIVYKALIGVIQVLIVPFQFMYEKVRIRIRAFGKTLIDIRPFNSFDKMIIEPLQQFGTVRLGIAIYPECETCDNTDYTTEIPNVDDDPELLYKKVGSGNAIVDTYLVDCGVDVSDESVTRLYLQVPDILDCTKTAWPDLYDVSIDDLVNYPGRFIIKFTDSTKSTTLSLYIDDHDVNGTNVRLYYYDDTTQDSYVNNEVPTSTVTYTIYDASVKLNGTSGSGLNSELSGGCQQYVTVYDESIVAGTYCVTDPSIKYSGLTKNDIQWSDACTGGKVAVGQVIVKDKSKNPCENCDTHSGFSEFRYGLFTIIPAASTKNWNSNFSAINEYCRRKLVAKLFCEGVSNYSFIDNWLTGSLYFFPFKAKVRWDNEENLDLNVRRTKYCNDLLYFKTTDKTFYYRSSVTTNGTTFTNTTNNTLGHPTTVVDLGPRDEFLKEICFDPSLDPNCSVVRNIGSTSFQDFKEMLGLYINYKLDYLNDKGDYTTFFNNTGYTSVLPDKMKKYVMNGDILQLMSINSEAGIEEFDLQNRNYAGYSPQVLDVESYPLLLDGGAFPINLVLDDGEGYRIRTCLNEPGRLTESSQKIPFYLWDKKGTGFGKDISQSWDYGSIQVLPLQGMTYEYKFFGNDSHKYVLFPMTKDYTGNSITITDITLNDVNANEESTTDSHLSFNTREEGFTFLHVTGWSNATDEESKLESATTGTLWTRVGDVGGWVSRPWTKDIDFVIKPTVVNYYGYKQILSTPFLFYFGIRPGKTAVDKFIKLFGPKGAFPPAE